MDTLRFVIGAITGHRLRSCLSALGVAIGLMPKGNLIAMGFIFLLFALRVNLATGITTAIVFSWVGIFANPLVHRLGEVILTAQPLEPVFAWFFELPWAAWTSLNNTVVAGSFCLGLIQLYPTYRWTRTWL